MDSNIDADSLVLNKEKDSYVLYVKDLKEDEFNCF